MTKTFLGDEVHELHADLQAARGEIELLKMNCERKDGEISVMKNQITSLKLELAQAQAVCEEKAADLVAVTTILQQTASAIGTGIQRVQRHKESRQQIATEKQERISVRESEPPVQERRVTVAEPQYEPEPPMVLHTGRVRPGIVDSRLPLPDMGRTQDDIMRDMNDTIGYQERAS